MAEPPIDRRGIAALVAAYAAYGGFWGAWVVVFADFLAANALTPGRVGLFFTLLSVIAIAFMAFAAPRLEPAPRRATIGGALGIHAAGSGVLALASPGWLLMGFALLGAGTGLIDVFVNAAGQEIEARSGRPVLQWIHAAYGAGGCACALAAGAAITWGASYAAVLVVAASLQAAAGTFAWRSRSLRRAPAPARPRGRVSVAAFAGHPELLIPAVVVMFAFFVEGSMDVWSVIFVRETLGSSPLAGASAFAAFALAIAVGRAFAARVLFRVGYRRTILVSGLGSLAFGAAAVTADGALVAGVSFMGLGFCLSAAAPAAFGMAGGAGADAGLVVGAITTVGYTGFVFGPPIMGWLADGAGLRAAMGAVLVAAAGMAVGGMLARARPPVEVTPPS